MLPPLIFAMLQDPGVPNGVLADAIKDHVEAGGCTVATVFVVTGETGDHSSFRNWNVAAFLDEQAAQELAGRLNDWCRGSLFSGNLPLESRRHVHFGTSVACPLDPSFSYERRTGTMYSVISIPLRAE